MCECHPVSAFQGQSRSVLVADDNAVLRKAVSGLLRSMGHRVDAVVNGREAIEAVSRSIYDLVLLDVQMPVMGGLEAAGRIAAGRRRPGRVVAVSGDAADPALTGARGVDAVLAKPVRAAELARLLDGGQARGLEAHGRP